MIPNRTPALDFGLGESADMLRDTVSRFAAAEIELSREEFRTLSGLYQA